MSETARTTSWSSGKGRAVWVQFHVPTRASSAVCHARLIGEQEIIHYYSFIIYSFTYLFIYFARMLCPTQLVEGRGAR
jgi:hypothetical protein